MTAESQLNCSPAWAPRQLLLITETSSLKGHGRNGIKQVIENTERYVGWGQGDLEPTHKRKPEKWLDLSVGGCGGGGGGGEEAGGHSQVH